MENEEGEIMASRKRKRTYEELKAQLILMGCDQQFYLDHVDEYMNYYDHLQVLNVRLLNSDLDTKSFSEILKEKRQVTKEMRNILAFLKLKPKSENEPPSGGGSDDEDETL